MVESAQKEPIPVVGRYALHAQIAFGGTATIHLGRLVGPAGFGRIVAIKRLHGTFSSDPAFTDMFLDEARLAARIRHPNVVSIIDVVAENGELLLVMDYVHGESLSGLLSAASGRGQRAEPSVVVKLMTDTLSGLHAAHELKSEEGNPLGVVHRDVSPQNILVAADGVAHLIDFGIAKAIGRAQHTQEGQVKGKLRYMAPEQIESGSVDRRTDVFAAAVVLWEALAGRYLFLGTNGQLLHSVLTAPIPPLGSFAAHLPRALQAVVMKGLERKPERRFATAIEMADALETAMRPATSRVVARWLQDLAADTLEQRARLINAIERGERTSGQLATQRESGPMSRALLQAAVVSDFSCIDNQDFAEPNADEPRDVERRTMPLPRKAEAIQTTSAVHVLNSTSQRNHWRSLRWLIVGIVALASLVTVVVALVARGRSHAAADAASRSQEIGPLPVPLGPATMDDQARINEPDAEAATTEQSARGNMEATTALDSHPTAPSRAAHKEAKAQAKPMTTMPEPAATAAPPSEPSAGTKRNSLYVRD